MTDSRSSRGSSRADRSAEHVELEERVFSVKKRFLAMYKMANAGHIGSSLSCVEMLGDEDLFGDLEIWSVGTFPLDELPADLIASIEEKRPVVTIEEHYLSCGLAEALSYRLMRQGVYPRSFTGLHAKGYPSGRYGSQRWHQEESGLAGQALRSELERVVRG